MKIFFQEPMELAPLKSYDHSIMLKPRVTPVNFKLYRVSHAQKWGGRRHGEKYDAIGN